MESLRQRLRLARVPTPIVVFFVMACVLNVAAVSIEAVCRFVKHSEWPYNSPLLNDDARAPDLRPFDARFLHLHSHAFFDPSLGVPFVYPAPVAPLYAVLLSFSHPNRAFLIITWCIALAAAAWFASSLKRSFGWSTARCTFLAVATLLLSYPLAFELWQYNMEIFLCVLVGLGVWSFLHDRLHAAAALFGIAVAMKLFPFVFAGLFIARRRFAPVLTMLVVTVLTTICSLRFLEPSIVSAWHGISNNLAWLQHHIILAYMPEIGFDHSLFALVKTAGIPLQPSSQVLEKWLHLYLPVVAVLGLLLYFFRIQRLPVLNQILCLYTVSVLLPPSSYDYTLLHLYAPWAMLVFFAVRHRETKVPGLTATFAMLAVLTSIQTEFIHTTRAGVAHVMEGSIKSFALLTLLYLAARFPFASEQLASESLTRRDYGIRAEARA